MDIHATQGGPYQTVVLDGAVALFWTLFYGLTSLHSI